MRIRRVIRLEPGDCVVICSKPQRPRPSRERRPAYTTVTVSRTYRSNRRTYD